MIYILFFVHFSLQVWITRGLENHQNIRNIYYNIISNIVFRNFYHIWLRLLLFYLIFFIHLFTFRIHFFLVIFIFRTSPFLQQKPRFSEIIYFFDLFFIFVHFSIHNLFSFENLTNVFLHLIQFIFTGTHFILDRI